MEDLRNLEYDELIRLRKKIRHKRAAAEQHYAESNSKADLVHLKLIKEELEQVNVEIERRKVIIRSEKREQKITRESIRRMD